jgi:hypothetical protein
MQTGDRQVIKQKAATERGPTIYHTIYICYIHITSTLVPWPNLARSHSLSNEPGKNKKYNCDVVTRDATFYLEQLIALATSGKRLRWSRG